MKRICILALAFLGQISYGQLPSIPTGNISIEVQQVASGLSSPVDMVSANDGTNRLFIVEQPGRIRILQNGNLIATPFLDMTALIRSGGEQGFLGLAFHPGFANSASGGFRKFYTFATETPSVAADFTVPMMGAFANQIVIAEWQVSTSNPNLADPASRRVLLRIDHPQANHNAGKIAFRPSDGYLYITMGDGGNRNDVGDGHTPIIGNAQDKTNVLGKILRIDPLVPFANPGSADPISNNGEYRIASSNPFFGASGLREIYAYGFRNPYRFSFDSQADQLIVGDVGQDSIEEVDVVLSGRNYGWNRKEGSFLFNPVNGGVMPDPDPDITLTNPALQYDHDDGTSVIGGFIYRGSGIPALSGTYVFGDFSSPATGSGRLFYEGPTSGLIKEFRLGINSRPLGLVIKGFAEDPEHELYLMADNLNNTAGQILKLIPIPAVPALLNLSTRARVETDDQGFVIAGFILTGSAAKTVVLRAIGPSLATAGLPVPGRLSNPTLSLRDVSGRELDANDDWMDTPRRQELVSFGLAPTDPSESAIVATLSPGAYTAIMQGVGGATGIGLVELFDVTSGVPANAVNLSTRARVRTGDNVLIGGLIIGGTQTQRVILRAIGPSLAAQGVTGELQDPTLELVDSSGSRLAFNNNWRSDQSSEIMATGLAPGNDAESAIVRTLAPGNYTAIVRGAGDTSGVALVEVFRLSP